MNWKSRITAVAVAVLLLCGSAWAQDTIKVGVVGPRTGRRAATGQAFDEGIKLATEYVNSKGGVLGKKLEIVFEDTAAVGEGGLRFERLVTRDKVVMVLGESQSLLGAGRDRSGSTASRSPSSWSRPGPIHITAKGYPYVFRAGPSNSGRGQ